MSIKILIADDHELIVDGLKTILHNKEEIEIEGSADNGLSLLKLIDNTPEVDLVLVDINMPDMDGIEVTRKIKELYPEIKVLILSMYKRSEFVKNLVSAGADGYILKNSNKQTLISAIKTLHSGESYFSQEVTSIIMNDFKSKSESKDMVTVELSKREKEVVKLISQEKSTLEIAEELYLSKHTVDSHRKSILNKLNVKNAAGIYKYALHTGIIKGFDL